MKCLVTGGAGHIGSHLSLRLHEEGHRVDIIDNFSIGNKDAIQCLRNSEWNGEFLDAGVGDIRLVSSFIQKEKYDICFHLAGQTVPKDSIKKPIVCYENNITPLPKLLSSLIFHGIGRIVICLPIESHTPWGVCGKTTQKIISDVCKVTPTINYSCFTLPEVVGNNIDGKIGDYGFDRKDKLIPNCMSASAQIKPNVVVDNGANVHHLIHVDDVVDTLLNSLEDTKDCVHEIKPGVSVTSREIVESCIKVTAGKYPVIEETYDEEELECPTFGNKNATITCLDTITKSTWNWIKRVRKIP